MLGQLGTMKWYSFSDPTIRAMVLTNQLPIFKLLSFLLLKPARFLPILY